MGNVLLQYPSGGPYTVTLTFRAESWVSDHPQLEPIQIPILAEAGNLFVFIVHPNVEVVYAITIPTLFEEDDASGFSGYVSLRNFVQSTILWYKFPFDFTDADGEQVAVNYWGGFTSLRERPVKGQWQGALQLRKVL